MASKNITFYYENIWNDHTVTAATEHIYAPAEYTQHRIFGKRWQSRHGAGSHWGKFYITSNNNKIDFNEGGGALVATLTSATYNADSLATEIETQLEASGAHSYTVEYIESGSDANKFKITDDTGTVTLLWNTGANKANSVADAIGFDDSADDGPAASHTADYIRIHTNEALTIDAGSRMPIHGVHIRGHNFQATAEVRVQGSNDNFATTPLNETFTIQDDILVKQWPLAKKYRYWRIKIIDVDNPDGYVEVGVVSVSIKFQPERNFTPQHPDSEDDPSRISASEGGQVTTIQEPHFGTWDYTIMGTDEKDEFDAMFSSRGKSKVLFYCEDTDYPLTKTRYVTFSSWKWTPIAGDRYNLQFTVKEER